MEQIKHSSLLQGFSKLNFAERIEKLKELHVLSQEQKNYWLNPQLPSIELAEKLIENAIGFFPIPIGVAVNFCIDGKDYIIPMAVEETSIIAAASKTARWIRENGTIKTQMKGHLSIGQIQFSQIKNFYQFKNTVFEHQTRLLDEVNHEVAKGLVKRGGGAKEFQVRCIERPDGSSMAVIHVLVDTCNAMGANIINQVCEYLKPRLEELTHEKVTMCILSNLNDTRLTCVEIEIHAVDPELGQAIQEASIFAELDPYRAATNNKGVLNGMDPILIATGNDWRAVEAGVHAYACQQGQYRSITKWRYHQGSLIGQLEAPIMVGIVGGMTRLHPMAQQCLSMLNIESADELARIVASVGLVQNLGAIRALTQEGIIQGHMKLHIDNLALSAGASESELPELKSRLKEILKVSGRISLSHATEILEAIRRY